MIRAILFDLDGTLLPIDTDDFIRHYLKRLSAYTAHLVEPERLIDQLMASTYAMIRNPDQDLTNQEVFIADFYPRLGIPREELEPVLERFYEEEFPKLREFVSPYPFVSEMLRMIREKGYELVIATNPLFPRSAIEQRIVWAGGRPEDFAWITTYEVSHYCKPNPRYFLEIAEKIGVAPEECLMVGNDVQEDLVAQQVGMKTWLVTDYKIDRGEPRFTPHREGRMVDFYREWLHAKEVGT